MANSLNLNPAYYKLSTNLSMTTYMYNYDEIPSQNLLIFNHMSFTILSQVAKLNSVYRPTCIIILKSRPILDSKQANNTRLLLKIAS